jgi:hypothetical protein
MPERATFCIVEGHGDVAALPILLRRIEPGLRLVEPPWRLHRSKVARPGELERVVERGARRLPPDGLILAVFDADDDLPCVMGPALLARIRAARSDRTARVVLACREFESWFIAAAESLPDLRRPVAAPASGAESLRGAKEWISRQLGRGYVERLDQPVFAAAMDLELARQGSASFRKLLRDLGA